MAGSSSDYPGVAVQRPLLQPTQVPPALSVLRVLCLFSVSKGEHLCWRGRWGGPERLEVALKIPDSSPREEVPAEAASGRRAGPRAVLEID